MPLVIPDETLERAGLDSRGALIEFACHLFEVGKLALWPAAQFAGLGRTEFEDELLDRKIAIYHPTPEGLAAELAAMERLGVGL